MREMLHEMLEMVRAARRAGRRDVPIIFCLRLPDARSMAVVRDVMGLAEEERISARHARSEITVVLRLEDLATALPAPQPQLGRGHAPGPAARWLLVPAVRVRPRPADGRRHRTARRRLLPGALLRRPRMRVRGARAVGLGQQPARQGQQAVVTATSRPGGTRVADELLHRLGPATGRRVTIPGTPTRG